MAVRSYDPKEVSVIVGSQPIGGFGDGDMVTITRNEDAWSMIVGATGETTRSKNANKSGTFTITLLASSESNDYLSELQLADELSGTATFSVYVKDNFGRSLYSAATAWIKKQADGSFGKESGTREWTIETDELIMFAGGN